MANFEYSEEKKRKDAALAQHNATKPGAFAYSDASNMDNILNQIQNGKKFSYDINGDALYQQYKDRFTTQGKLASMDAMGQAATATGGYGNSYAQSVGQQAYQGYLQQLNDKVPELYQLALNQFNQEKQDLYNQYALHQDKKNQEYTEYLNKFNNWLTEREYLANDVANTAQNEYNLWLQNVQNDQWEREHSLNEYKAGVTSGSSGGYYAANPGWDAEKIAAFQKEFGLKVDGIWGPETAAKYTQFPNWEEYETTTYDDVISDLNLYIAANSNKDKSKTASEIKAFLKDELDRGNITTEEYNRLYSLYAVPGSF